jgi:hypothetical protein
MPFFKKNLPAKSLAVLLMDYTITGQTNSHDPGRFALGPHGISVNDGSNVLPEGIERRHWEHLSSRDSLIIALETMYLRGFMVTILLNSFVKNKQSREAVLSSYKGFWASWSREAGLNYQDFYEKAVQVYGARLLIRDFEDKIAGRQGDRDEQDVSKMLEHIGKEFSSMCDPFDLIRDPLRSELAKRGEATFSEASDAITALLESVLVKYRITVK